MPERAPAERSLARCLPVDPAFLRFLVTGGANTALGFVLFHAFFRLLGGGAGDAARAQALSYAIGIAASYAVNRRWTFRSEGSHGRHLPRFVAAHLCALALSSTLMAPPARRGDVMRPRSTSLTSGDSPSSATSGYTEKSCHSVCRCR